MAEIVIKLVNGELAGKSLQSINKEIQSLTLAQKKATAGSQEFVDATLKLNAAKEMHKDLKKQIEATASASDQLKAAWNQLPGAQFFNKIGDSFGLMKQGVGGLVSQFGVLKTAIAATGIGLLVIVFATLVGWFQKTDEGATLLSGIFRGLGVVVDTVFGKLIDVFKGLSEYVTGKKSIKQGLTDLVDWIGNNLLNRVKAFLVIWDGIKNMDFKKTADGLIQLGTGITDATDKMMDFGKAVGDAVGEGIQMEKMLDAIEDKARSLSVTNAETEKEVSRLLLQSKNVGLSYKERIELLDHASALELKNHSQQLANAVALEQLRKKEIADNKTRNIETDELDQQLADAQIARINLEKESLNLQEKISNRRTALMQQEIAEREKAAAEELKIIHNLEDLKVQAMHEGLEKDIAAIQLATERKIEALVGSEEQILLQKIFLQEIQEQQVQALKDKYAADAAIKDKKFKDEQHERDDKDGEAKMKLEKDVKDFEYKLAQERMGIEKDIFNSAADLLASSIKNEKAAKAIRKTAAVAEIGMNLIQELSLNAKNAAANPLNAVTYGAAGSAQLAQSNVLSVIRAALATAKVVAFKKGGVPGIPDGVLNGPSHDQGGIPLVAEGREIILTKGVYDNPALRSIASDINVAGGGKRFASGGPVNPFNDRPPVSRNYSGSATTTSNEQDRIDRLENAFLTYAGKIETWATSLQVHNNVADTDKGIKTINDIKDEASV